jgi:hypothetical protein
MKDLEMKIKLLEEENKQLKKENEQLEREKEFWRNEAIKQAADHGETKIKNTKLMKNIFGGIK